MTSAFLLRLAEQLKVGKNSARRRAIERSLVFVTARFEAGKYTGQLDAEIDLRILIQQSCAVIVK